MNSRLTKIAVQTETWLKLIEIILQSFLPFILHVSYMFQLIFSVCARGFILFSYVENKKKIPHECF